MGKWFGDFIRNNKVETKNKRWVNNELNKPRKIQEILIYPIEDKEFRINIKFASILEKATFRNKQKINSSVKDRHEFLFFPPSSDPEFFVKLIEAIHATDSLDELLSSEGKTPKQEIAEFLKVTLPQEQKQQSQGTYQEFVVLPLVNKADPFSGIAKSISQEDLAIPTVPNNSPNVPHRSKEQKENTEENNNFNLSTGTNHPTEQENEFEGFTLV